MGTFTAGQILIVHFPFSDLTASKLRPALVLAEAGRGDWILCQITSKSHGDAKAIKLDAADFARGSLQVTRYARPGKLFTAHRSLVAIESGQLQLAKFAAIRDTIIRLIQHGCID